MLDKSRAPADAAPVFVDDEMPARHTTQPSAPAPLSPRANHLAPPRRTSATLQVRSVRPGKVTSYKLQATLLRGTCVLSEMAQTTTGQMTAPEVASSCKSHNIHHTLQVTSCNDATSYKLHATSYRQEVKATS